MLTRILRAGKCVQGQSIGIDQAFTPQVAEVAIALSGGCDADVKQNAGRIRNELAREEARFRTTLSAGEKVLNDVLQVKQSPRSSNCFSCAQGRLVVPQNLHRQVQ